MCEPIASLEFERRLRLPCHALFVGASMSGKSRLAFRLCLPDMFVEPPKRVLVLFQVMQPLYLKAKEELEKAGVEVQLKRGWELSLDDFPDEPDGHTLILIDDASEETAASKEIARLATNGRHKGLSLWLIWHSLYTRHPTSRIISQNMALYFFLPSPRLESQLRTFGSQLGIQKQLLAAYKRCLDVEPKLDEHRYILVDLSPNVPSLLRIRSDIHLAVQYCHV